MSIQTPPALAQASVLDIERLVHALPDEGRARFDRLFHVNRVTGEINPPEHMHRWIERYFGSVETTLAQKVVKITNRVTLEGALFNELRARRPIEARIPEALHAELARNAPDPFDEPLLNTPEDRFGRITGRRCVSASNVAKYDGWHSVLVFDEHDPLAFDEEAVVDYFDVARRWWATAHAADAAAIYPLFMWNCLWKAGASIQHGHAQVSLTKGMHYAKIEHLRRSAQSYRAAHRRNYFADLYDAHRDLGLANERDGVRTLVNLAPIKEKELLLFGQRFDDTFARSIHRALRCLTDSFGVTSFNLVVYLPPLAPTAAEEEWGDFPIVARMVDRGDPISRTADFGAMELYAASVVSSDPFRVAETLFE